MDSKARFPAIRRHGGTPFVGRQHELSLLRDHLEAAERGEGSLVLVGGEPGIGKSRLLQEFAEHARESSCLVLAGRAYDAEGMPPYLPFAEALSAYVRACPLTDLRLRLSDGAADVALVFHDVRSRLPELVAPRDEPDRYRLFESIVSFLRNIADSAGPNGLLLALDDLHWADKPTVLLLQHLARRLAGSHSVVIGAYRPTDLTRGHPLSDALADLTRERLCHRITLKPLSSEEVGLLVEQLSQGPAAQAVIQAIYEETKGNPFFVEEVVRHLRTDWPDLTNPGAVAGLREIPEGARQVIGRRLSRLNPMANQLLQLAAVLGDGFRFDVLAAASDMDPGPLVDALEETLAAAVLCERGGSHHFTHALIRQAIIQEMSTPRRARLHRQVAQAMERIYATTLEPHLAELAHHFSEAAQLEDLAKTIDYVRRAALRALRLVAYEEAARLYELALQALKMADLPDHRLACELRLELGEAHRRAGELQAAMQTFQDAAESARRLNEPELLSRAALGYEEALLPTGIPRLPLNDPSVVLQEEALQALPAAPAPLRARVLAGLARAVYFAGDRPRAAQVNEEAVRVARLSGDARALAFALNARCIAVWASGDVNERLATATELRHLAEEVGDHELALEGRRWRLYALLEMGDTAAVDAEIEAYARVAAELRQPQYLSHVALWRTMRALMDGRFAEVEALAQEMLATGRRAQRQEADVVFAVQMLALHRDRGDLARLAELEPMVREHAGRDAADLLAGVEHRALDRGEIAARRAHLAHLLAMLGRPAEARAELERLAASDFADLPQDLVWLFTLAVLVEVCAYLGDARRAAALYELMRPFEGRNVVGNGVVCRGPVAHYLGLAAATLGRWGDALAHFEAAAALAGRMDARPALARTLEAQAAALLARRGGEDTARARELLKQALA